MARQIVFRMTSGLHHFARNMDDADREKLLSNIGLPSTRFVIISVEESGVRHERMLNVDHIESVDL